MGLFQSFFAAIGFIGIILIIFIFASGCNQFVSQNQYSIQFESNYLLTDSRQVNVTLSVQNLAGSTMTHVVIEAYLLNFGENTSQDFKYLDHKQLSISTLNSGEKSDWYSIVLGPAEPPQNYSAYLYLKASSAEGQQGLLKSDDFTIPAYVLTDTYNKIYCSKINPYDLSVRKAASEAVSAHPGKYSVDQLLDIYDWVKKNIQYLNVPVSLPATPYPPSETLATKSGDCKNQAVLIASMVEAIGGTARVVADPSCQHAYAIVFFSNNSDGLQGVEDSIAAHYGICKDGFICGGTCYQYPQNAGSICDGKNAFMSYKYSAGQVGFGDWYFEKCGNNETLVINDDGTAFCRDDGNFEVKWYSMDNVNEKWIVFDTAGGDYPGQIPSECGKEGEIRYFIQNCAELPK